MRRDDLALAEADAAAATKKDDARAAFLFSHGGGGFLLRRTLQLSAANEPVCRGARGR